MKNNRAVSSSVLRIGYVPCSESLNKPGDRRRFPFYANYHNIRYEIANPNNIYDLVILSAMADITVWVNYKHSKIVYDLVDSYLSIPRYNFKGIFRGLFKFIFKQNKYLKLNYTKSIVEMCRRADAVICSTSEQRKEIIKYCDNVHVILDAHTFINNIIKTNYKCGDSFKIVWEGLPQNLNSLLLLKNTISKLQSKYPIHLVVVTDRKYFRYLGKYKENNTIDFINKNFNNYIFFDWNENTLAKIICDCDLAIIPINLIDDFACGKPENKLLLFWRLGMPVITSATPSYSKSMQLANQNYALFCQDEWYEILEYMILNDDARKYAGTQGKSFVENEHSINNILCKWNYLFKSIGMNLC